MSGGLARRRMLERMTKVQLIDRILDLEMYAEIVQEVYGASTLEEIRERNRVFHSKQLDARNSD